MWENILRGDDYYSYTIENAEFSGPLRFDTWTKSNDASRYNIMFFWGIIIQNVTHTLISCGFGNDRIQTDEHYDSQKIQTHHKTGQK
jgi:hypothetical protein